QRVVTITSRRAAGDAQYLDRRDVCGIWIDRRANAGELVDVGDECVEPHALAKERGASLDEQLVRSRVRPRDLIQHLRTVDERARRLRRAVGAGGSRLEAVARVL